MSVHGLQPKYTEDALIPDELIKTIICRCEKGCKPKICSCRKHGLRCSHLCFNCHGESCSNIEDIPIQVPDNEAAIDLNTVLEKTITEESDMIELENKEQDNEEEY